VQAQKFIPTLTCPTAFPPVPQTFVLIPNCPVPQRILPTRAGTDVNPHLFNVYH